MKEGKPIVASLEHTIYYPSKTANQYSAIIALHGRGTDEYDLIPLVLSLGLTNVVVISPRAPRPFEISGGFTWYDLGQEGIPDAETFRSSLNLLRGFLAEVRAGYPLDTHGIVLLGFSQGTVMAYTAALLDSGSFRGVAALSGYVPMRSGLPLKLEKLDGFPVFVSHGTFDPVIPVRLGRESADALKKGGANVEYNEYPMGHEVSQATIRDLSTWAKNISGWAP